MLGSTCIKFVLYEIMHAVLHFYVLFFIVRVTVIFPVFQLAALVIHGTAFHGEKFFISFDRVTIKEEELTGVLLCVQGFVRSAHNTQRSFHSHWTEVIPAPNHFAWRLLAQ